MNHQACPESAGPKGTPVELADRTPRMAGEGAQRTQRGMWLDHNIVMERRR